MSSAPVASSSRDVLPPLTRPFRALPRLPVPPPTRKPPPTPLALPSSSSSLSPDATIPPSKAASSFTSPNTRTSLDSARSDLNSMRSDLTSLHCSEFPSPPLALPTIPASPQTPRSLYFSSTPPSPRSRSSRSKFTVQVQDPPEGTSIGSPSSVKGLFPGSRDPSPLRSKFAQQQQQPRDPPAGGSSSRVPTDVDEESKLGYDPSRVTVPTNYAQYAAYKESNMEVKGSQPPTPTTAGTLTPRDWLSSSDRSSSLEPPRPTYPKEDAQTYTGSPLKHNAASPGQQDGHREKPRPAQSSRKDLSTQNISPKPPRAPLPVPPPSQRSSARYSHIARKVGVIDMGIDINEEQLLSTNFITELLQQPVASSPRSGQFLRPLDSPRSGAFTISDDVHGLSNHIRRSELHLATDPGAGLSSPGLAPTNVSIFESDLHSPTMNDNRRLLDLTAPSPSKKKRTSSKRSYRRQSDLHQSFLTLGEDKVTKKPSTPPILVDPLTLGAPKQPLRSHGTPHPLVPTSPMSPESFASTNSPELSRSSAHGQLRLLPSWRTSSSGVTVASRLPIGPSPGTVMGPRPPPSKTASPLMRLSRVRQRHYPRQSMITSSSQDGHQGLDNPQSQRSFTVPITPGTDSSAQEQEGIDKGGGTSPLLPELAIPSPSLDIQLSPVSHLNSTRPQHDSFIPVDVSGADVPAQSGQQASPGKPTDSRGSYESNFLSSESAYDDEEAAGQVIEGKVQTASRVLDTTIPMTARTGDGTTPTVVGTAKAVVIRQHPVEPRASLDASGTQESQEHEVTLPALGSAPQMSVPPSPKAPSHHTDTPESAKSAYFSDAHDSVKPSYLPHVEIAGAGTTNRLYDASHDASSSKQQPDSPATHAASFKSVVSYLTTRSKGSTTASKGANITRRSRIVPESPRRWTLLKRKPLPPLPPRSPSPSNALDGETADVEAGPRHSEQKERPGGSPAPLELGPYQRSKVSLIQPGQPQGWNDVEKWSPRNSERPYSGHDTTLVTSSDSIFGSPWKGKKSGRHRELSTPEKLLYYSGPRDFKEMPPSRQRRLAIPSVFRTMNRSHPKRCFWFSLLGIAVVVATVFGAALGTALIPKHSSAGGVPNCGGNKTGMHCNLDATCVCPSPSPGNSGCSAPLAQALHGLVPAVVQLFGINVTDSSLALVLYRSQGTPITSNCASQANLIDVGPFLGNGTSPNRTQWAQAALLWNFFKSGDINATQTLRTAVQRLPFDSLHTKDGIEADPSDVFTVPSLGYVFNFANQTVNPQSVTFRAAANPPIHQLAEVNSFVEGSLDHIYSFANASSTQQQTALSIYWRSVLKLSLDDLPKFLTGFMAAPILLPFDATAASGGTAISTILDAATNKTISFPPPIGCFPGLSLPQLRRISTVESQAFGLPPLVPASKFDTTCFANHPVYGILDVLRTRLPFSEFRPGVAGQAAVLSSDASSRVVLHVGELLSALPGPNITDLSPFDTDPREYGTLLSANHIALNWLQSFPNTALATEAAHFVISSPTTPPPLTSILFNSTSIPTVEVALFGNIGFSDLSSFLSSFSTPSGGLFFGSSQSDVFRRWALQQPSSSATVAWSNSTFAPEVVREGTSAVRSFDDVWTFAQTLADGQTNSSSVVEIVNLLSQAGLFSP